MSLDDYRINHPFPPLFNSWWLTIYQPFNNGTVSKDTLSKQGEGGEESIPGLNASQSLCPFYSPLSRRISRLIHFIYFFHIMNMFI